MSRRDQLAGIDPLDRRSPDEDESRPSMSMTEADAALFGALTRREAARQNIRPISIFDIYPDVKQARRAVPLPVRGQWSGEPRDIADLFNTWLEVIAPDRPLPGTNSGRGDYCTIRGVGETFLSSPPPTW